MRRTYVEVMSQLDPDEVDRLPVVVVVRCHLCGDRSKVLGRVHRHRDHGLVYQAWNSYWEGVGEDQRILIQHRRLDWTRNTEARYAEPETAVQDLLDWPAEDVPPGGRYTDADGYEVIVGTPARCDKHGLEVVSRGDLVRRARRNAGSKPAVVAIHH